MKIVDTKSDSRVPVRVRVNRTGRRTFSREYKLEVVQECESGRASVASIAMARRINANLLRRWIVLHRAGRLVGVPMMLPVTVSSDAQMALASMPAQAAACSAAAGMIEVELDWARVRVRGAVDEMTLRAVFDALVKR